VAIQGYFTEMLDKPSSTAPEGRALTFKSVTPRRFLNARPLVLVVDDDIDVRMIYRTYLRAQGCRVLTAKDGKHGTAKALRFKPDVIIKGSRGMSQVKGLLLGSVSQTVSQYSPSSVLIVR